MTLTRRTSLVAALLALLPLAATAQDFPSKPIKFMVGYAAGGPTDVIARMVAQRLGDALKTTVVVENRPGVGSLLGTDAVAKADRLRLRVCGTLVLLGWMLLAVGAVPPIFANVIDVDLTPIASNIVSYYFALPPGAAVILLALRPTHATPIRIVGVLGVIFSAAALYGALVPLWSVESSASTAGVSVFALNIIRSSGLALIAAIV